MQQPKNGLLHLSGALPLGCSLGCSWLQRLICPSWFGVEPEIHPNWIPSASQVHSFILPACMLSVVALGLPKLIPSAFQGHPKFNPVPCCQSIPNSFEVDFAVLPACLPDLIPSSASQGHRKFNRAPCSRQNSIVLRLVH